MNIQIKNRLNDSTIFEGEYGSLSEAMSDAIKKKTDLHGAYLQVAYLQWADLQGADLQRTNLQGANLQGAKINWQSHAIISEILRMEAKDDIPRLMIAGLIAIQLSWCWDDFMKIDHPEKQWTIDTLKKYVTKNDNAPKILKIEPATSTQE